MKWFLIFPKRHDMNVYIAAEHGVVLICGTDLRRKENADSAVALIFHNCAHDYWFPVISRDDALSRFNRVGVMILWVLYEGARCPRLTNCVFNFISTTSSFNHHCFVPVMTCLCWQVFLLLIVFEYVLFTNSYVTNLFTLKMRLRF